MTWNVAHGRGPLLEAGQWNHAATGWTVDAWATEEGALAYACDMVRKGRGVHSVWESGEEAQISAGRYPPVGLRGAARLLIQIGQTFIELVLSPR